MVILTENVSGEAGENVTKCDQETTNRKNGEVGRKSGSNRTEQVSSVAKQHDALATKTTRK